MADKKVILIIMDGWGLGQIKSADAIQHAKDRLVESGATVGAVLNKTRQYVPERLRQEFPGDQ